MIGTLTNGNPYVKGMSFLWLGYVARTWAAKFGDACIVDRQTMFAFFVLGATHTSFIFQVLHHLMSHYQGYQQRNQRQSHYGPTMTTTASVSGTMQGTESAGTTTTGALVPTMGPTKTVAKGAP